MTKIILEGTLTEFDYAPKSRRTIKLKGKDQNGRPVDASIQELVRMFAPLNPGDRGPEVRITIEVLDKK